ncbi:transposable element Tc3 transposase [Trichonephila clavipes]|nr:transposable element Tc3 transposase [Trichonephila clavipes]
MEHSLIRNSSLRSVCTKAEYRRLRIAVLFLLKLPAFISKANIDPCWFEVISTETAAVVCAVPKISGDFDRQSVCRNTVTSEKRTVWCALWAGGIIGPYFFKNDEGHNVTVNGDRYRALITNFFFIPKLNNHDVQELWFQQDGATCHIARATVDLLKDTFGDRLISRFGPVNCPPSSCDLTPLDYFLWGYVKSFVYADKPQTLDHLEDNIRRVPIYGHKCWKKSSKIGRPDWTTSELTITMSYMK